MNRLNRIERALTGRVRVMGLLLNLAEGYDRPINQCLVYEPHKNAVRELGQIQAIAECIRKPYKRVD